VSSEDGRAASEDTDMRLSAISDTNKLITVGNRPLRDDVYVHESRKVSDSESIQQLTFCDESFSQTLYLVLFLSRYSELQIKSFDLYILIFNFQMCQYCLQEHSVQ